MNSRMSIFNKLNVHGRHKLKDERNMKWMRDNHTNCWPHTSWLQALLHFAIAIITDANDAVMKHVLKQ